MADIWENVTYHGVNFKRVTRDSPESPRGVIHLDNRIIPEYPSISRAFMLEKALQREFGNSKFIVEEKVDGTNIRMVYSNDCVLAFTRGGYICPFTSEIAQKDRRLIELFQDFPNLVICGELVGQNPYNYISVLYGKDPIVYIFDIFRSRSDHQHDLLLPLQRQELLERYGIQTVPVYGEQTVKGFPAIRELLIQLNNKQREGLVFKATDGLHPRIKYVTFYACVVAIADHMAKSYEGSSPLTRDRFYLSACYLEEIAGMDFSTASTILGKAVLTRISKAVKDKEVVEKYSITITPDGWEVLKKRMSKQIFVRVIKRTPQPDGRITVEFVKLYAKSTGRLQEFLKGRTYSD